MKRWMQAGVLIFFAAWLAWLDILAASTAALPIMRSRSLVPEESDLIT